jgi:hypothetical protein
MSVSPRRGEMRDDAELGPIRWCGRCAEWWPVDQEFWIVIPAGTTAKAAGYVYVRKTPVYRCRACQYAATRVSWETRRDIKRTPNPHACRSRNCIVIVPPGRERCHGCERRLAGPLTVERLAEYGMTSRLAAAA